MIRARNAKIYNSFSLLKLTLTHKDFLFSENNCIKQVVEPGLVCERLIHLLREFEAEIAF